MEVVFFERTGANWKGLHLLQTQIRPSPPYPNRDFVETEWGLEYTRKMAERACPWRMPRRTLRF